MNKIELFSRRGIISRTSEGVAGMTFGILVVFMVLTAFTLSTVFSVQVGAQASNPLPAPSAPTGISLVSSQDTGVSDSDGITQTPSDSTIDFDIAGSFTEGNSLEVEFADGSGVVDISKTQTLLLTAQNTTSPVVSFPIADFTANGDDTFTLRARQLTKPPVATEVAVTEGASTSFSATIVIDNFAPVITVTAGETEGTFTVSATDRNGVDKYEVVTSTTAASCTASGTAGSTFESYTADDVHTIDEIVPSCFRVTDVAGNVAYESTTPLPAPVPSAPTGVALIDQYDTGFSATDGITRLVDLASAGADVGVVVTGDNFVEGGRVSLQITEPGGDVRTSISSLSQRVRNSGVPSVSVGVSDVYFTNFFANHFAGISEPAEDVDGTYSITATYTQDGQTSVLSSPFEFTVDRGAPIATILQTSGTGTGARVVTVTATDEVDEVYAIRFRDDTPKASCVFNADYTYESYTSGTPRTVEANTQDCFQIEDRAGNLAYVSTEDAIATGITSLTYVNSDNTPAGANNLLKGRTFTVTGSTSNPSTEYRLFVRVAGTSTWPSTPTSSGTSTSTGSVTQSVTLDADGDYELATQVKDGEDFVPDTLTATSEFTVDTTAPAISSASLASNNSTDTSFATTGNTITLTLATSEALASAPTVVIAGRTVTATGTGTSYTAVITVNSSTDEGAVTYDIGVLTDAAGNTFNQGENTPTGLSGVLVDRTDPTLSIIRTSGSGTAQRTVIAFAADANGISEFEIADDESTCSSSATGTFTGYTQNTSTVVEANTEDCFRAVDNAGNTVYASTTSSTVGIGTVTYTNSDNTPATTSNLLKTNTFTLAGSTASTTNYRVFVRTKNGSWPAVATASGTSGANGSISQAITQPDGEYEVAFQLGSNGSYTPAIADLAATSEFTIDSSAPTFTLSYAGTPNIVDAAGYYDTSTLTTGGVTVSNVVEANLATAVLTLARTDIATVSDITPTPTVNTATNTVSFANATSVADGVYTATVTLTDDAGNIATDMLNLVVDTATPNITNIAIDTPSSRNAVEATITVAHNQTIQESLTVTLAGDCTDLNAINLSGSGTSTTDVEFRGQTGTFDCSIILADWAGNTSAPFTVPTFTIRRSSSGGGGGGISFGGSGAAPTFGTGTSSTEPPAVQPPAPTQPVVQPPAPTQPTVQPPASVLPTLSRGSQGERVRALQQFLNQNGYTVSVTGPGASGQETTYFGPATERALRAYQTANGLPVTGQLDPQTQARMNPQTVTPQPATPQPAAGSAVDELKQLLAEILRQIALLGA